MALNPEVERMFARARRQYRDQHGEANVWKFDRLLAGIRASAGHVELLNRAQEGRILREISYDGNLTSDRSGFNANAYRRIRTSGSLRELRVRRRDDGSVKIKDGEMIFGDDIVEYGAGISGGADGTATALFILAHEVGHGMNAAIHAVEYTNIVNAGLAYIAERQAHINTLPPAEQATATIDIHRHLRDFLTVVMREEGRSSIWAYNAWVDTMKAQYGENVVITDDMRRQAFGNYGGYLLQRNSHGGITGALLAGLTTDSNGHIEITENNVIIMGLRNEQEQSGGGGLAHQVTYVGTALAYFAAHSSNATLVFNARELGFSNPTGHPPTTFQQSLNVMKNHFFGGTARIRDSDSGSTYIVKGRTGLSAATVTVTHVPAGGDPNAPPREVYIHVGNHDGEVAHDSTSIRLTKTDEGGWLINVRDEAGNETTLSPEEFEVVFGMSVEEAFATATSSDERTLTLPSIAITRDADGTETITVLDRPNLVPGGVRLTTVNGLATPVDYLERRVSYIREHGRIVAYFVRDKDVTVVTTLNGSLKPVATDIRINGNLIGVEFSDAGRVIGQQLGYLLAGDNKLAGVVASAVLQTVGDNLGDLLDGIVGNQSIDHASRDAFKTFGPEFLSNLKAAGIGAVSSFLTAELVNALGVSGFAAELANTVGGSVINGIITNIVNNVANVFQNVTSAATLGTAVGSFLGSKLANEIVSFDTIGGQLGAAIGSSLGTIAVLSAGVSLANGTLFGLQLGIFAGPVGAAVGAFIGTIVGGLIGSAFGGTPRSGADVQWDSAKGEFTVANVYSRKGGSKDAAKSVASAVAETFNAVIASSGARLLDPLAVQAGNYGMRKADFVYRPVATRDKNAITQRFSGKDAATRLIGYGIYEGLTDPDFQLVGGNLYVKRAIYNTVGQQGLDGTNFDSAVLLGNIATAQRYDSYLGQSSIINALIAAEPDSVFTAEWAITFARAVELGLTRRHESDWYGGFQALLADAATNAAFLEFGFEYDGEIDKVSRVMGVGDYTIGDPVDIGGQTVIEGTAGDDLIVLSGTELLASTASTNNGLTVDGAAHNGEAREIHVAATIDGADGDDRLHASDRGDNLLGGGGSDHLYGGKLDDWLIGGEGKDYLYAGDALGTGLGGNGNYLEGGAGNDELYGREGSDWLEGGDGVDLLDGGGGDDILAGGANGTLDNGTPAGDTLKGGHGDDQYLVRIGDGADVADESAAGAIYRNGAAPGTDRIKARFDLLRTTPSLRNWFGDGFDVATAEETSTVAAPVVAAAGAGGEDSIVFGQGIGIGDIRLTRLGGINGADLQIDVMTLNEAGNGTIPSGTQLIVRDWFADPFKRIEWLKFADGTELRLGDITSFVVGTAGNDVLIGTTGNDFVYAGSGDDQMYLLGGHDVGIGAAGDDMVSGDDGRDMVIGGIGADRLLGGQGADSVSGDAGNDDLYGGSENDILSGGRGDDQVVGGAGDDVIKYARGDGRDTVFDEFANYWTAIWTAGPGWAAGYTRNDTTGEVTAPDGSFVYRNVGTLDAPDYKWFGRFHYTFTTGADGTKAGTLYRYDQAAADASGAPVVNSGTDTIEFAVGISIQDVVLTRTSASSNDLVLTIATEDADLPTYAAGTDSITIRNWYTSVGQIENFAFYQTGVLTVGGTGGYNLVAGSDLANGTTSTPLAGTAGKDWMSGGAGDDVLAGGGDDDILAGNSGFDTLRGEAGNDVLYGGSGNDTLDGGIGADMLIGGGGMDTAAYSSISVIFRAYLGHSWANTGAAEGDVYDGIENLIGGTGGDSAGPGDVLGGDGGDNELTGGRGHDLLLGGAGNDSYMWNGQDWGDTIREGKFEVQQALDKAGALTQGYAVSLWQATTNVRPDGGYYWRLQVTGPGGEVVYDHSLYAPTEAEPAQPAPTAWDAAGWKSGFARTSNGYQVAREKIDTGADGGVDTIEFGANISLGDLSFERWGPSGRDDLAGTDLLIRYGTDSFHTMTIKDQYKPDGSFSLHGAVETMLFRDGLSVSLASVRIADVGVPLYGTDADDFMTGLFAIASDQIYGGAGNDVLSGQRGADTLRGEAGDDVLEGGSGTYADTLDGGETADEKAGDTVRYIRSTAVTVDLRKTTAQIGGEAAGDILIGIENVVGSATSSDIIDGNDENNRLDGLDGNNTLRGWGGDDVLYAGIGMDSLSGGDGDDALSGGEGNDSLWGDAGNDRLTGSAGVDKLYGGVGNDTLNAGDGDDLFVEGGDGDDNIYGEAGNDTLTGGVGGDLIDGGTGNDTLLGGDGDDRYRFASGSGADTLTDAFGINKVLFDNSVSYDRLWLTQSGQDLKIAVIGTSDVVTVTGFFAASGGSKVRSIETASHALFLDHADVQVLIAAMTADSPGAAPAEMPAAIAALLPTYWHAGGSAAPRASSTAQAISGDEDVAIAAAGGWGVVDHDGDALTYSVAADGAPEHGSVAITNAATGALTYTPAANYHGADSFTLQVKDAAGHILSVPVSVVVRPVADAPGDLREENGAEIVVTEPGVNSGTGNGSAVARLVATDPEGGAILWTIAQDANGVPLDAGGRFAIDEDGLLTVSNAALLNHEADPTHPIRVRATDATGLWTERDFQISVADANDQNSIDPIAPASIFEDAGIGTLVATAHASDLDSGATPVGQQRYYFVTGAAETLTSGDGRLVIDEVTGEIRVAATLDRETAPPEISYTVVARDNPGGAQRSRSATGFTLTLLDVNERNGFEAPYTLAVDEGTESGSIVGQVTALDLDAAGSPFAVQRYYFLHQGAASSASFDGRYSINAETGIITSSAPLDRETGAPTVTYKVVARDNPSGGGISYEDDTDVTITITDVNDRNSIAPSHDFAVFEDAAVGAAVGQLTAQDEDSEGLNAQQAYAFDHNAVLTQTSWDGRFAINRETGAITVAGALDHETEPNPEYSVVVRDRMGTGLYRETSTLVRIAVGDRNDGNAFPPAIALGVDENVDIGSTVGVVAASDQDAAGTAYARQRYSFVDNGTESYLSADGRFRIDAITGEVTTAAEINREQLPATLNYRVVARDNEGAADGHRIETDLAIAIRNVNERPNAPEILSAPGYVSERGTWAAQFRLTDPDPGDTLRLEFTSNPGTRFAISGTELRFTLGTAPDFETLYGQLLSQGLAVLRDEDNDGLKELTVGASLQTADALNLTSLDGTAVSVRVEDVNEAATSFTWQATLDPVPERDRPASNATLAAVTIGNFTIVDADLAALDTGSYDLTASDSRFEMIGTTLRLKAGVALDYEAATTISLTVTAADRAGGTPLTKTISFGIKDEIDYLHGTAAGETLAGQAGKDEIYGYGGDDVITGGTGDDYIDGGTGDDNIKGNDGVDELRGGAGADTIDGGGLDDRLYGGNEDNSVDDLYGDVGSDRLYGDGGDDRLSGGYGADQLYGGAGSDTANYAQTDVGLNAVEGVTADLATPSLNTGAVAGGDTYDSIENLLGTGLDDWLYGDGNANKIEGGAGSDHLYGRAGDDDLDGGAGSDWIYGGAGADDLLGGDDPDYLFAEGDNDTLDGGKGADELHGGTGADIYYMRRDSGADKIFEFNPGGTTRDLLQFKAEGLDEIEHHELWFERVNNSLAPDPAGMHVKVSLLGTSTSATIMNWQAGIEYQIEFISTNKHFTHNLKVGDLVSLMSEEAKPLSAAAHTQMMAQDRDYWSAWATLWELNAKPRISPASGVVLNIDEGAAGTIAVTLSDDITPVDQIGVDVVSITGGAAITSVTRGAMDPGGNRLVSIQSGATTSGTSFVSLKSRDAGDLASDDIVTITVNVRAVATRPEVVRFTPASGTSGEAGGIALNLDFRFPDDDGSEVHEITIGGIPAAVTLSAGQYDSAAGLWRLTRAQLPNLKLNAPAGWYQDLALTATATARENGTSASIEANATVAINTPPSAASFTGSVAENSAATTVVGTVVGTDLDNDALRYELLNATGSPFELLSNGTLRVLNGSLLNWEAATAHPISVRVHDATRSKDFAFSVTVTDVNEQNYFAAPYSYIKDETIAPNTVIGTIVASDPDSAASAFGQQRYSFRVNGAPQQQTGDGRFSINLTTGEIRSLTALSFEATPSLTYEVIARDNAGNAPFLQAVTTVTINLNDVNEPNHLPSSYTMSVLETATTSTVVGTVTAADDDLPGRQTSDQRYSFYHASTGSRLTSFDNRYKIDATTGAITPNTTLDRETMSAPVTYTVLARDNRGLAGYHEASTQVQIGVTDVNEQNSFAGAYTMDVAENAAVNFHIGTVVASDPDSPSAAFGQQDYFFVVDAQGTTSRISVDGRYRIDAAGKIYVNGALDHEAAPADRTYTILAHDNGGVTPTKTATTTVTIRVGNVNEQNALAAIADKTVAENEANATVTTIAATDLDGTTHVYGQQRYFFLTANGAEQNSADGRYQINSVTGEIRTNYALDYETMSAPVTYTVIARDNLAASPYNQISTTVKIGVTNRPEAPDAPSGPAVAYFDELPSLNPAQAGSAFATYGLTDRDGTTPQMHFTSDGNPGYWFAISGNQVLFTATFDFEWARANGFAIADYNGDGRQDALIGDVKVYANDGALISDATPTRFYLSDVNERPNPTAPTSITLHGESFAGEAGHPGLAIATFSMSDPDGTTPSLRILGGNDYGWFTTEGGTLKFAGANFTNQWLRDYRGTHGQDAGFYYDSDGDGLMEIRVATLTLAAADASGLLSDSITYNVLIEDRNEAPAFTAQPFSFAPNENAGYYQQVGTIAATDPDATAVAGELRYLFAGQNYYYDGALGRYVSASADGRFVVDLYDGRVWVNGNQALDFEGVRSFSYQTLVYDRSMGAHSLSGAGSIAINLQDVNEPHSLQAASYAVNESNVPLGPFVPLPSTTGAVINLRTAMLSDPEGRNMRWQFANGSTVNGAWQIEQDGTLRMVGSVDYEAMTDVYEEQTFYDWEGNPYTQTVWVGRDPSRAVVTLAVQAIDDSTGVVRQADLTINVADVNEDVTTSSYASYSVYEGSAAVTDQGGNVFWVRGEIREGSLVVINAHDPEGRALSYSLQPVSTTDLNVTSGGNDDIDSDYPQLSIDAYGRISFYLPPGSAGNDDVAWQGGTRTSLGRRTHSIEYSFNVQITDSVGVSIIVPYKITFIRRGAYAPPIVFDLDGDGLELVSHNGSTVEFDMDGDGIKDVTGWVQADDGLLALDRNGDGVINDFAEISFKRDEQGALTDLEGLRAFDTNANGFLDGGDERWAEFRIWRDANQDGISQDGELVSLAAAGIANVNLTLTLTGQTPDDAVDNVVYGTTQYQRTDGTSGTVGDVFLAYDPSDFDQLAAPIVLDYDGDGSGLVSIQQSQALFDMDGDGDRERTGWFAMGDALLVLDRNGDGAITDIAEISFMGDLPGATTDLEGLAAFDTDGDGALSTRDARYADFRLWFDNNGNGTTDAGELLTMAQAQVVSISLGGEKLSLADQVGGGNRIYARSAFTREDGSSGTVLDAAFAYASGEDGAGVAHSGWNGEPTASTRPSEQAPGTGSDGETGETPAAPAAPSLALEAHSYRGNSDKYRLSTQGGELMVGRAKAKGALDPRAGAVGPASMLSFGNRTVGYLSPLVFDLDGDGAEIKARRKSSAHFDMDGNGAADDTGWIGRGDAFLVLDSNGNGLVDDAAELSLLGLQADAKNSFEALATLDSNKNGKIDSGDARFAELRLWADRNGNGVTEAGELASLADHGIASIELAARASEQKVKIGENAVIATSTFTRTDGSTGSVADAGLAFKPARVGGTASGVDGDVDRMLQALRSGLDTADSRWNLARTMSRFEGFEPADPASGAEAGETETAASLAGEPRLAHLVQQMAAFGARQGDDALQIRPDPVNDRYDYYAA